ncbi:MAG: phosphatidylserine decarboxylase, partial [Pseudomonadota bacterium]
MTNRLPRRWLTLLMGRFSRIENPIVRSLSIHAWRLFVDDLKLDEAEKTEFSSLHDCFIRRLKPGARPVDDDPDVLTSPCDAVVGEFGTVENGQVLQAKGYPYSVAELLGSATDARRLEGSTYVTLRLKSSMYHRFHAP